MAQGEAVWLSHPLQRALLEQIGQGAVGRGAAPHGHLMLMCVCDMGSHSAMTGQQGTLIFPVFQYSPSVSTFEASSMLECGKGIEWQDVWRGGTPGGEDIIPPLSEQHLPGRGGCAALGVISELRALADSLRGLTWKACFGALNLNEGGPFWAGTGDGQNGGDEDTGHATNDLFCFRLSSPAADQRREQKGAGGKLVHRQRLKLLKELRALMLAWGRRGEELPGRLLEALVSNSRLQPHAPSARIPQSMLPKSRANMDLFTRAKAGKQGT
ncbi:hypothetical protein JZ751_026538, partial [Albula glossodonta]